MKLVKDGEKDLKHSEKVSEKYMNIASEIVKRVRWTGYMMIECIVTDNDIFLIEINPRPYGSLPLTIFSGVDMPKLLYGDVYSTANTVVAKPDYRARNFAKDLKWLKGNPMSVFSWLCSFRHIFLGKECFDVERLSDILPSFAQLQRPFDKLEQAEKAQLAFHDPKSGFLSFYRLWQLLKQEAGSQKIKDFSVFLEIFDSNKFVFFVLNCFEQFEQFAMHIYAYCSKLHNLFSRHF